jgi:hypothetical protein
MQINNIGKDKSTEIFLFSAKYVPNSCLTFTYTMQYSFFKGNK